MIFVTLGSQKFQFNRLLVELDNLVDKGLIKDEIFAQIGNSTYCPKNYRYSKYLNRDDFSRCLSDAEIVITHGGTGAIVGALKAEKKVIAVPRLKRYEEHVDDHQVQIVTQFKNSNIIEACYDVKELFQAYENSKNKTYDKYVSNTNVILEDLQNYLSTLEKKKVCVVSNLFPNEKSPYYGVFVKSFCDQLKEIGISYDKIILNKSETQILKIFNYLKFYCFTFIKCIKNDYDLVYVHYASHSSLGVIAARIFKKFRVITNLHGSDVVPESSSQRIMNVFTKIILKLSDKVVVPSEYFKKYVFQKYNINKSIFVYESGGVDDNIFIFDRENRSKYEREFGLGEKKIRIGYVGRITADKGWDVFVKSIGKFKNREDFEFVIVGDGKQKQELYELIESEELNDNIKLYPLLDQISLSKMYNCLDILVFPTMRQGESLGLVAIEAMACGAIVIASDFAAPKYYIKDGINGFKFKMGSSNDLFKKILFTVNLSDEEKNSIITNATAFSKKYSPVALRDKLLNIINN